MLSHEEMVGLQKESHDLIEPKVFRTKQQYVLHLMHTFAYEQAAALSKGKAVLDLGCNTGYGSEILFRQAKSTTAVDVSEKAIKKAKENYGKLAIDFRAIDGKSLPFEDNSFDVVVSCQVIEHIVDHSIYMKELMRVLENEGIVFFTTPNAHLRLDEGMKPWNPFHVREYRHEELKSALHEYFPHIEIFGLKAQEPLYSIEANRLKNERANARIRAKGEDKKVPPKSLRSVVKGLLPDFVLSVLRQVLRGPDPNLLDENFKKKHGTSEFFYSQEELEDALDLLALCSGDDKSLRKMMNSFFPK